MKESPSLPVMGILLQSVLLTRRRLGDLFKVSSPFIFMLLLVNVFTESYLVPAESGDVAIDGDAMLLYLLLIIPCAFASIMAACVCHRIFLLPETEVRMFHWSNREWRFLSYSFIIASIIIAVGVFVLTPVIFFISLFVYSKVDAGEVNGSVGDGTIGNEMVEGETFLSGLDVVSFLIILPLFYLFSRLAFVLPAVAIGRSDISLRWSWRLTRKNGWRLVFLTGVIPVLVGFIDTGLASVFDSIIWHAVSFALYIPLIPFNVCLLSLSYAYLSEEDDEIDNGGGEKNAR